jgi:glycosyltransferase involved in cell wall biosynthesis
MDATPPVGARRIAVLAPRLTVQGPIPKITPLLAAEWRRSGREVELLPWGRREEIESIYSKVIGRARDVLRARRTVGRGEFPVVLVNTSHDWLTLVRDLVLLLTLRRRNRVVVVHIHGSATPRLLAPGSWLFKRATAALVRSVDALLVLSRQEVAEWHEFSPDTSVFVVRNPLTEPLQAQSKRRRDLGETAILCVARLIAGKGVFELVRALPLVQRDHPCRLVLAGDGPEKERLKQLAVDLNVAESVEVVGYVQGEELAELYRRADVFALPTSMSEGFPTAILEAMAAGLPIVTTASRGPADHLVEGRNALFVPPHDREALAASIARLLADDELRQSMSQANRSKVQEFDPERVAEEYLAVLDRIVVDLSKQRTLS